MSEHEEHSKLEPERSEVPQVRRGDSEQQRTQVQMQVVSRALSARDAPEEADEEERVMTKRYEYIEYCKACKHFRKRINQFPCSECPEQMPYEGLHLRRFEERKRR